ncbi:MAG TPA: hypothetical protein PLR83_00295 [Pyrinomonadaceae bacterium]|nr:hypothetical protein [Pyrinomonadaceae bacterium]
MSDNSNTNPIGDESRRLHIVLGIEEVNEMLATLKIPLPDAAELDEISITVCASDIHDLGT